MSAALHLNEAYRDPHIADYLILKENPNVIYDRSNKLLFGSGKDAQEVATAQLFEAVESLRDRKLKEKGLFPFKK